MFNRVSYQATPSIQHRRSRTEPNELAYDTNPERSNAQGRASKNLDNIEIKLLPPQNSQHSSPSVPTTYHLNHNLGVQTEPADSLD